MLALCIINPAWYIAPNLKDFRCVFYFIPADSFSAGLTSNLTKTGVRTRGICSMRSGLTPKAFTRCNHLISSGEENHQHSQLKKKYTQGLANSLKHESSLSQEVLRGEDRHLLRLAGILHDNAGSGGCGRARLFHLWI